MSETSKRAGRPALDASDPSVPLTVSFPSKQLAAAEASAERDRVTVQDWIRTVVRQASGDNKTG